MTRASPVLKGNDSSFADLAADARVWLFDHAARLWSPPARRKAPLFPERMSIDGVREACPHRLFVQARHVFSYCELGRLGWTGPWRDMVGANIGFLLARGRRADGFYVHRFDPEGEVFDSRADLYDQAFMLLALAHAGRALSRPDLFEAAEQLDEALEQSWRHPHGGYREGEIAECPPHRQNPHMHLLEAFLALHDASGSARWLTRAKPIADLAAHFFIDPSSGALLEYFDAELRPVAGAEGRIVEPGHCFEWAWLFETLARWGARDASRISDALIAFARQYGIDHGRGIAINEVMTDGSVRNAAARLWPQAERLKAALARYRRTAAEEERLEAVAAYEGLTRYLETPACGAWRDKLRADGSWVAEPAPGSSLYHIVCALAELIDAVETVRSGAFSGT